VFDNGSDILNIMWGLKWARVICRSVKVAHVADDAYLDRCSSRLKPTLKMVKWPPSFEEQLSYSDALAQA
jgi:hypothetical protein